jgi:cytochrome c5
MIIRHALGPASALLLSLAAGCSPPATTAAAALEPIPAASPAASPATAPAVAALPLPLPLPVPINAVMVAMVDFAADGIWRPAVSEKPLTNNQWLLAEQDAVNLVAAATLITTAGTGVNDAVWVADPDWRRWATDMQNSALQAKAAVGQKDQARLKLVGDDLVETCQACHQKFKPGLPSMGITRFPIYPKRDGSLSPA